MTALSARQQRELVERERKRMADPGYRDTLESPHSDYETVRIKPLNVRIQPLNIKLRKDCSCLCSQTDEYGRALVIGRCGDQCERRPQ